MDGERCAWREPVSNDLTRAQKYAQNKAVVRKGMASFVEVGFALMAIRDEQQYLEEYTSWDAFCKAELNQSARRAYQLIAAAKFTADECEQVVHKNTPSSHPVKTAASGLNLPTSTEVAASRAPDWAKTEGSARRAKAVKDASPKKFKEVKEGKKSVGQAEREIREEAKPRPNKSGVEKVSVAHRKNALALYGKLYRIITRMGLGDRLSKPFDDILTAIKES